MLKVVDDLIENDFVMKTPQILIISGLFTIEQINMTKYQLLIDYITNHSEFISHLIISNSCSNLTLLNEFLGCINQSIRTIILSNEHTNHHLPQQPIHNGLINSKNCSLTTNPCNFILDQKTFMGNDGKPILDIMKNYGESNFEENYNPIDITLSCLKWGHIAPTAPDTLRIY